MLSSERITASTDRSVADLIISPGYLSRQPDRPRPPGSGSAPPPRRSPVSRASRTMSGSPHRCAGSRGEGERALALGIPVDGHQYRPARRRRSGASAGHDHRGTSGPAGHLTQHTADGQRDRPAGAVRAHDEQSGSRRMGHQRGTTLPDRPSCSPAPSPTRPARSPRPGTTTPGTPLRTTACEPGRPAGHLHQLQLGVSARRFRGRPRHRGQGARGPVDADDHPTRPDRAGPSADVLTRHHSHLVRVGFGRGWLRTRTRARIHRRIPTQFRRTA